MRTLIGGIAAARAAPLALVPHVGAGVLGAVAVAVGLIPSRPVAAPVVAAFPMDIYFDLKHALGHASGWGWFAAFVAPALVLRSAVLAATLWIAEGRPVPFRAVWGRALKLGALALPAFVPAAVLFFAGVALRYAPFVWVAAGLAVFVAMRFARQGAALEVARGISPAAPSFGGILLYGYCVSLLGVALWTTAPAGSVVTALVIVVASPLHALFLLGWRAESTGAVAPGANRWVAVATAVLVAAFAAATLFDRERGQPAGGTEAPENEGSLLLVGGADSTTRTGALVAFDARAVGFRREATSLVSYRAPGERYEMEDTRADPRAVAPVVAAQVAAATPPAQILGHSQAALIVDHMIRENLATPERAAVIAGPPPRPPHLEAPGPEESGPGYVGATATRWLQAGLETAGFVTFDVDADAAPTNLEESTAAGGRVERLAVWALGDSVWLDGDWRRPDETNLVVLTDHVGAVKNPKTIAALRDHFAGRRVPDDESSWRGLLVNVVRFAFEPWRP